MKGIKSFDWIFYLLIVLILTIGVVAIFSITYHTDRQTLAISQLVYAIVGLILLVVFSFLDYRALTSASTVLYVVGIILLLVVLFLGRSILGSTRWIDIGFFRFQPSEIFKIILILTLASYLSKKEVFKVKDFVIYIFLVSLPTALVLFQPDLGTALVYLVIGTVLFLACRAREVYILIGTVIVAILLPVFWAFALKDYQRERLLTFLDPSRDPFGSGYNVLQSTISVGSGGLWGRGLGHGTQSQLNFLPIQHSDFIFAVIAEELGFVGAGVLLVLILLLLVRILGISAKSRDALGRYIAFGVAAMIIFQVLINVGMNIGLMPVTGIPLPLVSHGGSSLFTTLISLGVVGSIYLRHKKITFE